MSRCRLRAVRGQRGLPLCRVSPHRDNEGWSTGKDVQSSLTVCVPSELRPVSSVTIQLLWPPSAPPLSSWSLSRPVTHNTLNAHTHPHTYTHKRTLQYMDAGAKIHMSIQCNASMTPLFTDLVLFIFTQIEFNDFNHSVSD